MIGCTVLELLFYNNQNLCEQGNVLFQYQSMYTV